MRRRSRQPGAPCGALAWSAMAVLAALLLTGLGWMLIDTSISPEDFDSPLRTWRHRVLVGHGILAYGLLWLAGSLLPRHQLPGWQHKRRRLSGSCLAVALLGLALSALGLYYPPGEATREVLGWLHQGLGLVLTPLVLWHLASSVRRARRPAMRPG